MMTLWHHLNRETGWNLEDARAINAHNLTALRVAIKKIECSQFIPQLLDMGADPNHTHPHLLPILHTALMHAPQYVELLLKYGADPFIQDNRGKNFFDCAVESSAQTTDVLLKNNIGVFEIRRRYYDPQWDMKIPPAVREVICNHIALQRRHGTFRVNKTPPISAPSFSPKNLKT